MRASARSKKNLNARKNAGFSTFPITQIGSHLAAGSVLPGRSATTQWAARFGVHRDEAPWSINDSIAIRRPVLRDAELRPCRRGGLESIAYPVLHKVKETLENVNSRVL